MATKRKPVTAKPDWTAMQAARTAQVPPTPAPQPEEPTIGAILGLDTASAVPNPAFAAMADTPEELDAARPPHRPGEHEPPQQPADPQPAPVPTPQPAPRPGPQPPDEYEDLPSNPAAEPPIDEDPAREPPAAALERHRYEIHAAQRGLAPPRPGRPAQPMALDGEILGPSSATIRYEARIQIVDAWRYPGQLATAPEWIDRNWAGWGDHDTLRNIEAGPCLRVPLHADPSQVVLARIGDYVCRQAVTIDQHLEPELRLEVWPAEQFHRMFIPTSVPAPTRNAA